MWLVNAALRYPYSVWVGMLLVTLLGWVGYTKTPTDILPAMKVPVVVVFASYRGMPAPDMEQSVTSVLERALTKCDQLEHIQSRSLLGIGIIHVYFKPEVDPDVAASQVISLVQGEMQNLPPGMLPPNIMKYDASAIPVGHLIISSKTLSDLKLLDIADHKLRDMLAGVEGLAAAPVFGGVFRQVQIYVDPIKLKGLNLSAMEVARIVSQQSQVIPTGEARFGSQDYYISSNSMVKTAEEFKDIPLKSWGRRIIKLGDVAQIKDDERWRTNTVLVDGQRAVYMPLLRQGGASAVKVVDAVKDHLPKLYQLGLEDDVKVEVAFDQAQYVRDALNSLTLEGLLGAVLASLVVLLFLGSLRSSAIVALSIPLSILAAFVGLYFTGHTLNIMTLGGIALVVGRVVDDSIVAVENTVRHLGMAKTPLQAARDSAEEIAIPILMATITTVIVFFPITFMTGMGKYLFTPLAVSAALAMFASYIVSRTVSPMYCARYLRGHGQAERLPRWLIVGGAVLALAGLGFPLASWWLPEKLGLSGGLKEALAAPFLRVPAAWQLVVTGAGAVGLLILLTPVFLGVSPAFQRLFERVGAAYERALGICLRARWAVVGGLAVVVVPALFAFLDLGQELFPEVDSSDFTIHLRANGGPRVEETEHQVRQIEDLVRTVIPEEDLDLLVSNIGLSSRWSAVYTPNNGPHAALIRVQLRSGFAGRKTSTASYVKELRQVLERKYPGDDLFFETGGMIRQILNNGAVAPIEVQVHSGDPVLRRFLARRLDRRIGRIPQVTDTYMPQGMDLPQLRIDVDRTQAQLLGFKETEVIQNVITALMSSAQLVPNFWIDPQSGNPYLIGVQYPQSMVIDKHTLEEIPITPPLGRGDSARQPQMRLDQVARIVRTQGPVEIYHYRSNQISQIFVSVGGQGLAHVAAEVERVVAERPLKHALDLLPHDKRNLEMDERFKDRLDDYLREPKPERQQKKGQALLKEYGVDPLGTFPPNKRRLENDPIFMAKMEDYLRETEPDQQTIRAQAIQKEYGVNPVTLQMPLRLPKGTYFSIQGEVSSMRESFREMGFTLLLAVVLLYLLMAAQFASWVDPLIMIVAAPLGFIGVSLTLWATGTSLNIQSIMGVLMMFGISQSNSTLLVDFANRLRESGMDTASAVVRASRVRLQPILMTSIATFVSLAPLAIHLHPGDEMNLPLARAVIGGLLSSTLLTLFMVPVLYTLLKPREALPHTE